FNLPLDAERITEALELTMEFIDKMLKNDNIKKEIAYLSLAPTARRISPPPVPSMFVAPRVPPVKLCRKKPAVAGNTELGFGVGNVDLEPLLQKFAANKSESNELDRKKETRNSPIRLEDIGNDEIDDESDRKMLVSDDDSHEKLN
ncbi:18867_t:CDS:2, partial [Racocetra fulgida]